MLSVILCSIYRSSDCTYPLSAPHGEPCQQISQVSGSRGYRTFQCGTEKSGLVYQSQLFWQVKAGIVRFKETYLLTLHHPQGSADRATRATNSPWLCRNRLKKKSGRSENFQKIKKKNSQKVAFCVYLLQYQT